MSNGITQVDGCAFSTEELQRFHRFYKFDWAAAGMDTASLPERIQHFASSVDADTDCARLQAWLRTMGIVDDREKTDAARLYERFEQYDFAAAPGFNQLLTGVYGSNNVSRYGIGERMDSAKAKYYNQHVEPLDYAEYRVFKESAAPRPVCPYQHLWESSGAAKEQPETAKFASVKTIDIANLGVDGCAGLLTLATIGRIRDSVREAYDDKYHAVAIVNSSCSDSMGPEPVFLPALDASGDIGAILRAAARLQIDLRSLNKVKPLIMFANGTVDASALGILFSTSDLVASEMFAVNVAPGSQSSRTFPFAALYDWAHLSDDSSRTEPGTAEYILSNPDLVLRSSEWMPLGLDIGFVAHRKFAVATEAILLAASCPPPNTRDALRKACAVESAYPGPSRIGAWKQEIRRHFAPLANCSRHADGLFDDLRSVGKPWAHRLLTVADDDGARAVVAARISGLQAIRGLDYPQALALELAAAIAWPRGETSAGALYDRSNLASLSSMLSADTGSSTSTSPAPTPSETSVLAMEIPGECPFARMYRKNPDRFKHVDLKAIADHRALNI